MNNAKELNVEKDLIGMQVLLPGESRKWADVTDAVIHPTEGRLMGLALSDSGGQELLLAAPYFTIEAQVIRAKLNSVGEVKGLRRELLGGAFARRELVGSSVVGDDGRLFGRVTDIFVSAEQAEVNYRVSESRAERFFGGGFLIAGALTQAYSRAGGRIIVPREAAKRHVSEDGTMRRPGLLERYRDALHAGRMIIHKHAVILWLFMATILVAIMFWL